MLSSSGMTSALDLALAAARSCAVTVRFGGSDLTYSATVTLDEPTGRMQIHVRQDNALREAASKALASATREAIREALRAAGIPFKVVTWGGKAWRQTGYGYVRQFCCNGRYAELVLQPARAEVPAEVPAAVASFKLDVSHSGALLRLRSAAGEEATRAFGSEAEARAVAVEVRSALAGGFAAATAVLKAA